MRIKLYSILVYNLLFTQAPIPVCLDGTIIRAIIVAPDIIQELFFMVSRSNVNDNFNLQCCTEKPHSHVPTCFFTSGVLVVSLLFRSPKATDALCYRATCCCGDWFQKVCLREVKFSLERG